MTSSARLLIIDDNSIDRELIRRLLGAGYETFEASSVVQGLDLSARSPVDCVLLDYRLPDLDGIQALDRFVRRGLPVVMLTGQGDELVAVEAMKRGAQDYLIKVGLEAAVLRRAVDNALEKRALSKRIEAQTAELEARVAELAEKRTELESITAALSERETKLRVLLQQLPVCVWTADTHSHYLSLVASKKVLALDEEELVGRPVGSWLGCAEARQALLAAHRGALAGRATDFEYRDRDRDHRGRVEPLEDEGGRIVGAIGVSLDVTETRRLEQQLLQSQKMDAIGQLAGGIAHDFNNILTVILSFTDMAQQALAAGHPAREQLAEVMRASERAADLVRQLLTFSRRRPVAPQLVEPAAAIGGLLPMLGRLLGEDIRVVFEPAEERWYTRIDPLGLEQILINLAVNARDAMPRGGRLVIATRHVSSVEPTRLRRRADLPPGDYVVVSVSDEGDGIPPELLDQIFEPFFTTKEVGKGTGLGLSTCYGIARQAGGTMSVYSELGLGTTFQVYLPRSVGREDKAEAATVTPGSMGGSERILVVEDEPQLRALVVRMLETAGYTVLAAADGDAARALLDRDAGPIDLLLSDVVMPGVSGPELMVELRQRRPDLRALFMSGYAPAAIRQRGSIDEHTPIIEKPFTPTGLCRRVREALQVPRSGPSDPAD